MQIKDVEELLQMTSYTIRYYEKIGLIHPQRDENGYRQYTNEDIRDLKKIRFLRDLEIPIEDIENILNHSQSFQEVLEKHLQTLSSKMKSLEYAQSVCEELKEKNIPLLDAMIDEKIIINEKIDQKQMTKGLQRVVQYLKPSQTVVIGARETPIDFIIGVFVMIFTSLICGLGLTFGIANTINYMNRVNKMNILPSYSPSIGVFIIITLVSFLVLFIILYRFVIKQDYIELTDQNVSICSQQFQRPWSIFLGMLLKQTHQRNQNYGYEELSNVDIKLKFSTMSGGKSGLWNIYVPIFIFHFIDGQEYCIESGVSFGEKSQQTYNILKQKQISMNIQKEVQDFFEQSEQKGFDYFEAIYHHNGKRIR